MAVASLVEVDRPREGGNPVSSCSSRSSGKRRWVPASAGATTFGRHPVTRDYTTAPAFSFTGFTRSSRFTPSHLVIGAITSTDE